MQIKNRQQLLIIVAGVAFGLLIADALVFTPLTKAWEGAFRPDRGAAQTGG